MKSRIVFATATALGALAAGTALAGSNNVSYLDQDGDTNSALIDQSAGSYNEVATSADHGRQAGEANYLLILQAGDNNKIGFLGQGLEQIGKKNWAAIGQDTDLNVINQVRQTVNAGITVTPTAQSDASNAVIVGQGGGNNNTIDSISQTLSVNGFANSALITQNGAFNIFGQGIGGTSNALRQQGAANVAVVTQSSDRNRFESLAQVGVGNNALVTQTNGSSGASINNQIYAINQYNGNAGTLLQDGTSNYLNTSNQNNTSGNPALGNTYVLSFTGNSNGRNSHLQYNNPLAQTLQPMIAQANVNQTGGLNALAVTTVGDRNLYGYLQWGAGNWIVGVVGDAIAGADDNNVAVVQQGDGNYLAFNQHGDDNDLAVHMNGNGNVLAVVQNHTLAGGGNGASVTIFGNNNNGLTTPGMSGAADTARLSVAGLTKGQLMQRGAGNSIDLDVGLGSSDLSSNNLFAFAQIGNLNIIDADISGGNANQMAVTQSGDSNFASVTQVGGNNILGVMQ